MLNNLKLAPNGHSLGPIAGVQLPEDIDNMPFYRPDADH